MAARNQKTKIEYVTVSPRLQAWFTAVVLVSTAVYAGYTLWSFVDAYGRHQMGITAGSWLWPATQIVLPVAFLLTAYFSSRLRYKGWLPRLAWSTLIMSIGLTGYQLLVFITDTVRYQVMHPRAAGWWSMYGMEFGLACVCFALYMAALGLIDIRRKGK